MTSDGIRVIAAGEAHWRRRSGGGDRVQAVVLAYESGVVAPGDAAAGSE